MKRSPTLVNKDRGHASIMVKEVLEGFKGVHLQYFYEATLGAGGHAKAILQAHPEIKRYIGCDKDPEALRIARKELAPWKEKVEVIQGDFADLDLHLREKGILFIDGFFLI